MADHEAAKQEIEIENAPATFKSVIWKQLLSVCRTCKNKTQKHDGQTTNNSENCNTGNADQQLKNIEIEYCISNYLSKTKYIDQFNTTYTQKNIL